MQGKASGNETEHQTEYTNKSVIERDIKEMDDASAESVESVQSGTELYNALQEMEEVAVPSSLDNVFSRLHIGQQDERRNKLQEFYEYCDELFYQSEVSSSKTYASADYKTHIQETVKAIVGWDSGMTLSDHACFRPSSKAEEVNGVPPFCLLSCGR